MSNSENKSPRSDLSGYLFEWLGTIVFTFILVILIFTFIGLQFQVHQTSMNPTLYEGDRVLVFSLFYKPKFGDIVIFTKENYEDGIPLVKRIIATEGQTVDINSYTGTVTVDGEVLQEDYIADGSRTPLYDVSFPLTVPDGYVFAMGDNRNVSKDSRMSAVGFIDEREILGKVIAVITPLSHFEIF